MEEQESDVKGSILLVDDDDSVRQVLGQMLRTIGYESVAAADGPTALRLAGEVRPDLILMDVRIGSMTGYDVCRSIKGDPSLQRIPIIFISGMGDLTSKVEGFEAGGVDYITKPVQLQEVAARIDTHLSLQRLQTELQRSNDELEQRVAARTLELERNVEKLRQTLDSAIYAMAKIVEIRDPYTAGHQQRVAELTRAVGQALDLDESVVTGSYMTAMIHDIGKLYVPADILNKPGKLSELEMELIRTHAQHGAEIARMIDFDWPVDMIISQHHERLDGSGYPEGLQGEEIVLQARILSVADAVEAMSSHRPYRPTLGLVKALETVEQEAGTSYDPAVVDVCLRLFREDSFQFSERDSTRGWLVSSTGD